MKNSTFNVGDLVFEIALNRKIILVRLMSNDSEAYPLKSDEDSYDTNGFIFTHAAGGMPGIFHATPENRQALITLCGENEVPELPSYGSDLTRKLLKTQKYVLCKVSSYSDGHARELEDVRTICSTLNSGFIREDGEFASYAVPIDMNGNEITEINYNE